MIGYSFKINKKSILTNLFVAVQLAVVFVLLIITVSSVKSRINDYIPLRRVFSSNGKCVHVDNFTCLMDGSLFTYTAEEMLENEKNISEIYSQYKSWLFPSGTEMYDCSFSYSKNMAELYIPKMKKGQWIDKADENSDMLEVVISDSVNHDVGDIITFRNINKKDKKYSAKVIGIIPNGEKVLGLATSSYDIKDFRDMYQSIKGTQYFFSYEQLEKKGIPNQNFGLWFAIYRDGLRDDELLETNRSIYKYGPNFGLSDELNVNSINYIKEDIILIFPIAICILILTVISEVALIAIQTRKNLKTYAILCICGSNNKKCALINLINIIVISVLAIIMTAIYLFINYNNLSKDYYIEIGSWQLIVCSSIVILNMLLSVIIPYSILSKRFIIEVLKEK